MGWFSGKYENDRDASKANTISDREYRDLQKRAAKANPKKADFASDEAVKSRQAGKANYEKRWWN